MSPRQYCSVAAVGPTDKLPYLSRADPLAELYWIQGFCPGKVWCCGALFIVARGDATKTPTYPNIPPTIVKLTKLIIVNTLSS